MRFDSKITSKIAVLLSLVWFSASAQLTIVKPSSGTGSSSGITSLASAYDTGTDYLTTGAKITSAVGLTTNDRYIQLNFTNDVPANTPVYLKIKTDTPMLQILLGGALGSLISSTVSGLVDGSQTVTVEAWTNTGITALASSSTFNTESFKVVVDKNGDYFIKITTAQAYRKLKIINRAVLGLTDLDKDLWVYGAYYATGSTTCTSASYTSYSGDGLLNVSDYGVFDPQKAIDNDNTTFSQLKLGVVSVASSVEQTVHFEGAEQSGGKYNIKLGLNTALLQTNILSNITITGYSGTGTTAAYTTNLNTLLGTNTGANAALQSGQPATITLDVPANTTLNRITVKFTGLLNISTAQVLNLYSISKGNFDVAISPATTSFLAGAAVTLSADITNGQCGSNYTYAWSGPASVTGSGQTLAITTPSAAGTYNYTVLVTNTDSGLQKTITKQITVPAPPVGGNLNSITANCSETASGTLTLTGYTGNIMRWEKSSTDTFAAVTEIANTLPTLSVSNVAQTEYYRAMVSQNGYAAVPSSVATVTPKTTTWNGTIWTNGTPDINTIANIEADYNAAVSIDACRLVIKNNAVVTIPSGFTIRVDKAVKVISGSLTVQNNAALIQNTNTEANEGNIIVNRNANLLYRLDYTMWSSPVAAQQLQAFSPATTSTRFYKYAYNWQANPGQYNELFYAHGATNNFAAGTGYLVRMPNVISPAQAAAQTTPVVTSTNYNTNAATQSQYIYPGVFTGIPNNGTISVGINFADLKPGNEGQFLNQSGHYIGVGNPYPSPISVTEFLSQNSAVLDAGDGIYFWRKTNDSSTSSYAQLTLLGYTKNNGNVGGDIAGGGASFYNPANGNNVNWIISPGQGFIVKLKSGLASSATVNFTNTMRKPAQSSQAFFRTVADNDTTTESRWWLNLTGTNNTFSQTLVGYIAQGTAGLDYGYDGRAMEDSAILVYSLTGEEKLGIQARPLFASNDVVPVGFAVTSAGEYTLTLDHVDGAFAQGQNIYLVDALTGITTNISEGAYTFTSETGTFNSRFTVVYEPDGQLDTTKPELASQVVVYQQNSTINIASPAAEISSVAVYDIGGRKLYEQTGINKTDANITNLAAAQQVLIVEVNTVKGKVTKKVIH